MIIELIRDIFAPLKSFITTNMKNLKIPDSAMTGGGPFLKNTRDSVRSISTFGSKARSTIMEVDKGLDDPDLKNVFYRDLKNYKTRIEQAIIDIKYNSKLCIKMFIKFIGSSNDFLYKMIRSLFGSVSRGKLKLNRSVELNKGPTDVDENVLTIVDEYDKKIKALRSGKLPSSENSGTIGLIIETEYKNNLDSGSKSKTI